ncbi:MAG: glutamyl-tRNA reductase [Myxococcales bacterium]|nr:glutamyl-tRNA reductase [Myxococcales bacterium]
MAAEGDRLLAVGLSHHTAPVEVRERLAMDEDTVKSMLGRLQRDEVVEEALMLSTCNRVELYAVPRSVDGLREFYGSFRGPAGERIDDMLYWYRGREAVRHLFRVASSLDSLVLGEPQILGQVKEAVRVAGESSSLGRVLHPLTQRTLSIAKRVRNQTDIGKSRVGIGNAGVDLALQIFGGLEGKRCMLIGVGEMGRQVAVALLSAGLEELLVANRTFERSVQLASEFGGTPVPYERLQDYLPRADIVLAATGATKPIVTVPMVRTALRHRRYRTIFLVDLSVPRNVDPGVDELEDAYLFNIDDLSRVVEEGREARAQAAADAMQIVEAEADRFIASLRQIDINDDLRQMAATAEALRQAEVVRSRKLVAGLDDAQLASLDAMTKALVKKLLHRSMTAVRTAAKEGDVDKVQILLEPWKEP